jgi:hypothetical protein
VGASLSALDPASSFIDASDWSERQIVGLGGSGSGGCFDARNAEHRFLTLLETAVVTRTVTATMLVEAPATQTVSFASRNACLPTDVDRILSGRCK